MVFWLLKSFDQLPKFASYFLALDRKFKITQNDIIKISINCQKRTYGFLHLIKSSNNGILGF
jgi:hypothetical protein